VAGVEGEEVADERVEETFKFLEPVSRTKAQNLYVCLFITTGPLKKL